MTDVPGHCSPLQPPLCLLLRLWNSRRRPRPGEVARRASRVTRHSLSPSPKFPGASESTGFRRRCRNGPRGLPVRTGHAYRNRAANLPGARQGNALLPEQPRRLRHVTRAGKSIRINSIPNHLGCGYFLPQVHKGEKAEPNRSAGEAETVEVSCFYKAQAFLGVPIQQPTMWRGCAGCLSACQSQQQCASGK